MTARIAEIAVRSEGHLGEGKEPEYADRIVKHGEDGAAPPASR